MAKNETKTEHIKGKYAIIVACITLAGGIIALLLNNGKTDTPTHQQTVQAKEISNSPITSQIQTQNNYYNNPAQNIADTIQQKVVTKQTEAVDHLQQNGQPNQNKDKTADQSKVNAQNALIVTTNQSGGNNTVNYQTIDAPKPEVGITIVGLNTPVTTIPTTDLPPGPELKTFGNTKKDSVFYRTELKIKYFSQVERSSFGIIIKRNDVVHFDFRAMNGYDMEKWGMRDGYPYYKCINPENGYYQLVLYTNNKLEEFVKSILVMQN
jgi:hypothetical protein